MAVMEAMETVEVVGAPRSFASTAHPLWSLAGAVVVVPQTIRELEGQSPVATAAKQVD